MTRIAFTMIGGKNWTGGYNYLINLARLLSADQSRALTPVMFFGTDVDEEDITPFAALNCVEVVRSPLFNRSRSFRSLLTGLVTGADWRVRKLFRTHRIDVVFEVAQFFGFNLGIPAIAWIPDFQHRFLPHLFSKLGYWKRDIGFRIQVLGKREIMLSSEDSRVSCEVFYPSSRGRTHVVRFAVPPKGVIVPAAARALADKYGLPERYIFLPNQFWQHKNHLLVVEALTILRRRGQDVTVVACGSQSDPRDPSYFPRVKAAIDSSGLSSNFILLGLIPYGDLAPLATASMALLNPSLFEGWSTTVEEALSWGVPLILSDLDVNREQAGEAAVFFDRHDAQALADALASANLSSPDILFERAANAQAFADERVNRFITDFQALVQRAATKRR
ncbi:glycosyltransferase [Rhizobium leguminosarum]|uniref:glycosyltransferase n=1 Tax=Rhizobium leguminosarum TaxID=384 RepID=UPI001C942997|nr:glycosyltransferase family 1 protein [Rhizobium leguminosarum]MBY5400202.1 glycosyltransferase family 4 protein [Rhizobium leguminosarum]